MTKIVFTTIIGALVIAGFSLIQSFEASAKPVVLSTEMGGNAHRLAHFFRFNIVLP